VESEGSIRVDIKSVLRGVLALTTKGISKAITISANVVKRDNTRNPGSLPQSQTTKAICRHHSQLHTCWRFLVCTFNLIDCHFVLGCKILPLVKTAEMMKARLLLTLNGILEEHLI